jgi:hypothetical protein
VNRIPFQTKKSTYLDNLVPSGANDDGVLRIRAESHTRNPFSVALVGNGILAVAESVPELDSAITRTRDDLTIVSGEGYGEDVVGVADEPTSGDASRELPEAESFVPGGGEGVCTVRRDDLIARVRIPTMSPSIRFNIRSRRRCESGRAGFVWDSRTTFHHG